MGTATKTKARVARGERERSITRKEAWVKHIREHCNTEGLWHSNTRSRSRLPMAESMKDRQRLRVLAQLVDEGKLERPFTGYYRKAEQ